MDLNKVMLIGRSTGVVDTKTIDTNHSLVTNFVIATNRKFTNKEGNEVEEAEYHRCIAYGKSAEVLTKYITKGKKLYIEGRIKTRKRQDNTGITKYATEIIVSHFIFLDSKGHEGLPSEQGEEEINDSQDQSGDDQLPF